MNKVMINISARKRIFTFLIGIALGSVLLTGCGVLVVAMMELDEAEQQRKLDSEPPSDLRPLGVEDQLVKRSAHPTQERITVDVVFVVGWNVVPGRYDVELLFSVEPL